MRTALTLQRDHDFKLARIREYLDAARRHRGRAADVDPRPPRRYRRDELLASGRRVRGAARRAVSAA
jgi:hypothetical protein